MPPYGTSPRAEPEATPGFVLNVARNTKDHQVDASGLADETAAKIRKAGHGSTRALIIDDHELVRGGLKLLLKDSFGIEECREAGSLEEALEVLSSGVLPDLVTFDLSLPGMGRIEGLAALIEAIPNAQIVVVSGSETREDILSALGVGAHGYIPKSLTSEETVEAIGEVLSGRIYAPMALRKVDRPASAPIAAPKRNFGEFSFTGRQTAVLECLLTGASTRKIASELGLAEGTVKIHLAAIYRILGVHSRAEVIARMK